ncbi:MAG: hypothetical protein ISQ11_15575 [Planctomycetes bacterium]|nr:hypothetical protein [Planctomycetota bacterium]
MRRIVSLILLAAALCSAVHAQAFCALRDPNRQIYRLFPKATSYRSIVRTVDKDARREVGARLPFNLHFNELGRHTLYVPMRGDEALGLVHVRSEAGRWGLVEVAWGLDLDLRVINYEFQRCRDRQRDALETEGVRRRLTGADFGALRAMLSEEGDELAPGRLPVEPAAVDLALTVLRNGLKTIAATEAAWMDDLTALRADALARELMPGAKTLKRVTPLHDKQCLDLLNSRVGEQGTGIQRGSTSGWQVLDREGKRLGSVITTAWQLDELTVDLVCAVDREGRILGLRTPGSWPTEEVERLYGAQVGKSPGDYETCAGPVELAVFELLTTLESHALLKRRN